MNNNKVDFYHLEKDTLYEVRKTFIDYYGGEFARRAADFCRAAFSALRGRIHDCF
jgi:hypothetical protein